MADLPRLHVMNIIRHLERVKSAASDVREGIATHAEKEHVRREVHHAKMTAELPLRANTDGYETRL